MFEIHWWMKSLPLSSRTITSSVNSLLEENNILVCLLTHPPPRLQPMQLINLLDFLKQQLEQWYPDQWSRNGDDDICVGGTTTHQP